MKINNLYNNKKIFKYLHPKFYRLGIWNLPSYPIQGMSRFFPGNFWSPTNYLGFYRIFIELLQSMKTPNVFKSKEGQIKSLKGISRLIPQAPYLIEL